MGYKKCLSLGQAFYKVCGERGIRTPDGVTHNGFQDRRIRPLCHFSNGNIESGVSRI